MLPFKHFNSNLTADLERLGLSASSANQLSESRISESTYAPLVESTQGKAGETFGYTTESESPLVSESTIERIEALIDTGSLSAGEAETLLNSLAERAPEGSLAQYEGVVDALAAIADGSDKEGSVEEALLSIAEGLESDTVEPMEAMRALLALIDAPIEEGLEDLRDEVIESIVLNEGFRQMLRKIGGVFKKVKVKKMTSAEKAKSRAEYRKNRAKIKTRRKKLSRTAAFKKNAIKLDKAQDRFGMGEANDFASRLRSRALGESHAHVDEFGMVARIGRIFSLLSERVDESAVEVMAEQFDLLKNGLFESESDLEAACRPSIAIIAECLKEIEQGNC